MARYSDNREINREMKYLYKTWSKVDSQIELPASLTGDALLPLLERVPTPQPPEKQERRKIQFSPKVFSWKSATTYAAALVLIVALSAVLGRGPANLESEGIKPVDGGTTFDGDNPLGPGAIPYDEGTVDSDQSSGTQPEVLPPTETQPIETEGQVDQGEAEPAGGEADGEGLGIGGPETVKLLEDANYQYTYRVNDVQLSDYPITVFVTGFEDGALPAAAIDIAAMKSIDKSFLNGAKLALIGDSTTEEGAKVLQVYDLSRIETPDCVLENSLPGTFVDAKLHQNILNIATFAPAGTDISCEIVSLPHSTGDDLCVITAIDLDTSQFEQKAFSGASESISLFNLNAYLDYVGEPTDSKPEGRHVAHIRLDGTAIELRGDE